MGAVGGGSAPAVRVVPLEAVTKIDLPNASWSRMLVTDKTVA